jgi:Holliday junction resolvase RusA-like endonuclease
VLTFTVPGQPQGKGRAKIVKIGGFTVMATPAKTVAYEGLIAHAASLAMDGAALLDGAVAVDMRIDMQVPVSWSNRKRAAAIAGSVFPTTKPDADNVLKTLDGLNGVVWRDDAQVVDVRVVKRYAETPCLRVEIRPLGDAQ